MKVTDVQVGDIVKIGSGIFWCDVIDTESDNRIKCAGISGWFWDYTENVTSVARPMKIPGKHKIKPSELEAWFWRQEGAHAYRFDGTVPLTGEPIVDRVQIITSTAAVISGVGWCRGPNMTKAILELRKRLRKAGVFKP